MANVNVKRSSSNNSPFLILGALIVLGLGFIGAMSQRGGSNGPTRQEIPKENQTDLKPDTSSINTIIYGGKGEDFSLISAVNDSGINNSPVTTLESNVKFITPLVDGKRLLFIADTDDGDMGGSLALKDIVPSGSADDGDVRKIYSTSDGYMIDRYVVSEDQKWIAWYEVKAPDDGGYTHENDFYRVFKANLGEVVANGGQLQIQLMSNQKSGPGVQIALPSAITNSGMLYYDFLIPSTYALYYGYKDEGMNVVLPLNSYNSTPYLFKQRYLLYTAYDPNNSRLPSTSDTDSTRDQIVNTNIIKTYDLQTKEVVVVGPGDEGEQYKHPVYVSGEPSEEMGVVAEVYKVEGSGTGSKLVFTGIQYIKRDKDGKFTKDTIVEKSEGAQRILEVGELPSGDPTVIVGEEITFRGNLGTGNGIGPSGYKNKLKSIKIYNLATKALVSTVLPDTSDDFEFVSVMSKLEQERLGIQRNKKLVEELSVSDQQLKLGTFVPVEPKRERKNPRSECETEWEKKGYPNYEACEACPVYVYDTLGRNVSISPVTPIDRSSAVPSLKNDTWNFKADKNGNLTFYDGVYKRIDYDFPRGSVEVPREGVVLSSENLSKGIADYAHSLGFNTREIDDIVHFFASQLNDAPYVLFATLSQKEVNQLLSLKVSPKPEAYMSQIFYAKKLSSPNEVTVQKPKFHSFTREDFTVVVWGSVID